MSPTESMSILPREAAITASLAGAVVVVLAYASGVGLLAPLAAAPVIPAVQAVTTATHGPAKAQRLAQAAAVPARPVTPAKRVVAAEPTRVAAPQSSTTLQPLILVVGAAVAAVLFCLLLMASRTVSLEDRTSLRSSRSTSRRPDES